MADKKKWVRTLERIVELSNAAEDLKASFPQIALCLRENFLCNDCWILIHRPEESALTLQGASSPVKKLEGLELPTTGAMIGYLHQNQRPLFVRDTSHLPVQPSEAEAAILESTPMTLVPITDNGFLYGLLCMGNQKAAPFSRDDTRILSLICGIIAGFLRTARIYGTAQERLPEHQGEGDTHEGQKEVKELLFLNEASKALLTTLDLDEILHIVLTAITLGEGLGFNRGMVLLVDEKRRLLRGRMAVGPDTPERAQNIWAALSNGPMMRLSELILHLQKRSEESQLDAWTRQLTAPFDIPSCILTRTIREGRFFITRVRGGSDGSPSSCGFIEGGQTTLHRGCHIHRLMIPKNGPFVWASVPLWGRNGGIGTILVDNVFNNRPITNGEIRLLSTFAKQAGLAVENAMLLKRTESASVKLKEAQESLIHNEKMVALGQMADHIAHKTKNPLVSIGGFARRLDKALEPNLRPKKYSEIIIKEVTRLERVLHEILDFSRDSTDLHLNTANLNEIVKETLDIMTATLGNLEIQVISDLDPNIPDICCDDQQIRQVMVNILSNAIEAMKGRGRLSVRTRSFTRNGRTWVSIEIADTAGGIDQEILPNIFNPFFSTKDIGTGLGLAVCHKIVLAHHGSIEVDNRPGEGTRFVIKLPQDQREDVIATIGPVIDGK